MEYVSLGYSLLLDNADYKNNLDHISLEKIKIDFSKEAVDKIKASRKYFQEVLYKDLEMFLILLLREIRTSYINNVSEFEFIEKGIINFGILQNEWFCYTIITILKKEFNWNIEIRKMANGIIKIVIGD